MRVADAEQVAATLAKYSDLLPGRPVRDIDLEAAIDDARERLGAVRTRRRDGTPLAQLTLEG